MRMKPNKPIRKERGVWINKEREGEVWEEKERETERQTDQRDVCMREKESD
jgi:hypothetical protein